MRTAGFLALALVSGVAGAMDLKGVAIGTPWDPKAFEGAFNKADAQPPFKVECDEYSCMGYSDIGPCSAHVHIAQTDGKVGSILIDFPPTYFGAVADGLLKKNGKPKVATGVKKQTGLGLQIVSQTYMWARDGQSLVAEQYTQTDRSSVFLTYDRPSETKPSSL